MLLEVRQELVTPSQAQLWLNRNTINRPVTKSWVSELARDMLRSNFLVNGETIVIAKDGTLLDGQHRLLACVAAAELDPTFRGFVTLVVFGIDKAAFISMGGGLKRTVAHKLGIANEVNCTLLGAALRQLHRYEHGLTVVSGKSSKDKIATDTDILALLDQHPNMRASAKSVSGYQKGIKSATLALTDYLGNLVNPERTKRFMTALRTEVYYSTNDPARTLARKLRDEVRKDTSTVFIMHIKALNAALTNNDLARLSVQPGEQTQGVIGIPFGFPVVPSPLSRTLSARRRPERNSCQLTNS